MFQKRLKFRTEGIFLISMMGDLPYRLFEDFPHLILEIIDTCSAILTDDSVGTEVLFQIFEKHGNHTMHAHFTIPNNFNRFIFIVCLKT